MVYKRVDRQEEIEISGFCYTNSDGYEDRVTIDTLHGKFVEIDDNNGSDSVRIIIADIPLLIKALKAVCQLKGISLEQ